MNLACATTRPLPQSERLRFREFTTHDTARLAEVFADAYALRFYPGMTEISLVRAWIDRSIASYGANGFGMWALELKAAGSLIGDAGLTWQSVDGVMMLEVGYHVHVALRGRGYATEAARACLDFGFRHTTAGTICSIVDPANGASITVANRVHAGHREFESRKGRRYLFHSARP